MTSSITKSVRDLFGKLLRPVTEAAPRISDRTFLRLLLLGSACGAVLFQPRFDVGFFNDDASFVLLARRLWNYLLNPSGPGVSELFSHFMPGFPLFLAPFAAAFEPRWAWLRCAAAAVSLLTVYGLWRLLDGWVSAEERRWTCSLYALHPLFLLSSGMVMADPFLACLFVYALLALRLVLEGAKGIGPYLLLGSTAAWAVCTKPIGILLPAALTAGLLAARAWKGLRLLAVLIWLPCLAAGLAALLRTESPTDYLAYLVQGLASLAQQPLWQRAYNSLHAFLLVYGLAFPWPRGPAADLLGAALISGLLYLGVKGLSALSSRPLPARFAALAAGLLVIGQGLVLSLWTAYSERYALPLLPFGILFIVAGLLSFAKSRPLAARALLAAAALGFLVRAGQLALETNSPRRPAETRLFFRTLDWIRSETPPDSRFLGRGAVIELYTGRSGHGVFAAPDADALLLELSRFRITHALVTDQAVLSTRGPYRTNQGWQLVMERAWIRSHPRNFKKVYSNAAERTEVYAVALPARLEEAAGFYELARKDILNADWPAAEAKLRRSLAAEPDFTSALMALAALPRGVGAAEAERLLRRVLALEPNYAKATLALAELLERQGRRRETELVRAAGRAAFAVPPFEAVP